MLGAEGVKTAIIRRLMKNVPKAIVAVSNNFKVAEGIIPIPKGYYPSAMPDVTLGATGTYPFVTVTVTDTDGELSSYPMGSDEGIEQYQMGYNILITIYVMVSAQENGQTLADLQAERLTLVIREALRENIYLDTSSDDIAKVNTTRWIEEYAAAPSSTSGAWKSIADISTSVITNEMLDRTPYFEDLTYFVGYDIHADDPVTGDDIEDSEQGYDYPEPDVL